MAKDPKERYGSGIKLVVDLQPYVDATLERPAPTFHGEPSSQPKMASAGIGRATTYPWAWAQPIRVKQEDALVRALDLSSWIVHQMAPLVPKAGLDVVVEGSLGPLISRGGAGGLRFVHLSVSPDPRQSTFPLMEAFPLFLEAALRELVGIGRLRGRLVERAGGELALLAGEEPSLVSPSGSILELEPLPSGTGFRLPEQVGRYLVGGADPQRPLAIAVLDHPGRPARPLTADDALRSFPESEREVPAGLLLLAVLLGLLIVEWLSYHLLLTD